MHGGQQYSMLLFGSKSCAWASYSSICRGLQYLTPSVKELLAFQQKNCPVAEWKKREAYLERQMTKYGVTVVEKSIYKGLKNLGVLEKSPVLKRRMNTVVEGKGASRQRSPCRD